LYGGGTANTEQFKTLAETISGRDLDTFFNQWIYGEGFPIYSALWNQRGNQLMLRLKQDVSMPTITPLFYTPLQIKFYSGSSDTTVQIYNNATVQQFVFNWSKPVDRIEIDPRNYILNRVDSIRRDYALFADGVDTALYLVYPNPGSDHWTIDGMPEQSSLVLYDAAGRTVWTGNTGSYNSVKISTALLSRGSYLLYIVKDGRKRNALKLIKSE
jgi:hypothetical protein